MVRSPGVRRWLPLAVVAISTVVGCESGVSTPKPIKILSALGNVKSVAFSPDSRWVAAGTKGRSVGGKWWAGEVRVWLMEVWLEGATLPQRQWVNSVAFSPDGSVLAVACGKYKDRGGESFRDYKDEPGEVILYSTEYYTVLATIEEPQGVATAKFSPDGKWLAVVVGVDPEAEGQVKIYDGQSYRLVTELKVRPGQVGDVAFSSDGRYFATTDCVANHPAYRRLKKEQNDRLGLGSSAPELPSETILWRAEDWQRVRSWQVDVPVTERVAFAPDGSLLFATGHVFDLAAGPEVSSGRPWRLGDGYDFTANGTISVAGHLGFDDHLMPRSEVVFAEIRTTTRRGRIQQRQFALLDLDFSPDGRNLATGGWGGATNTHGGVLIYKVSDVIPTTTEYRSPSSRREE